MNADIGYTYNTPYQYIERDQDVDATLDVLIDAKVIGVDTETTGLDPYTSRLLLIQLATQDMCYVYDARKINLDKLKKVLENENVVKLAHNAKYDYSMLKQQAGITMNNMFCTMIAEMVILSSRRRVSLEKLCVKYLNIVLDKSVRTSFVGHEDIAFSKNQLKYAAEDSYVLVEIYNQQVAILIRDNLLKAMVMESQILPIVADMELKGCKINRKKWLEYAEQAEEEEMKASTEVKHMLSDKVPQTTLLGEAYINTDSHAQMLYALKKAGINVPNTTEESLKAYKGKSELVDKILVQRAWGTIVKRYGRSIINLIHPSTNRIHPEYNQVGAVTGRMSSEHPNAQNIPVYREGEEVSLDLRSCFIPERGHVFVGADFSQQELRILAEMTGDEALIDAFIKGADIHTFTASQIYKVPLDKVTKAQRTIAKTVNFLINYGGSAYALANRLGITIEDGEQIINSYFRSFNKVKRYVKGCFINAMSNGYSETVIGRRRYYTRPKKDDVDYNRKAGTISREACNHTIQGSAAEVTKQSLIYLVENLKSAGLYQTHAAPILVVHDEIVVETKKEYAKQVKQILEQSMLDGFYALFKRVPMVVDAYISHRWEK